jgi:hypothetical protein
MEPRSHWYRWLYVDKTQVFHDQIELKHAKINSKQVEVDVVSSERDALAKNAGAVRDASKEAKVK